MDRKGVDTSRFSRFTSVSVTTLLLICFIVHSAKRLVAGLRTDAPSGFSPVPHGHLRPEPGELVDYRCSEVVSKRTIYLNYLNYVNYLYLLLFCVVVTFHAIRKFYKKSPHHSSFCNLFCSPKSVCCFFCSPIAKLKDPILVEEFQSLVAVQSVFRFEFYI